LLLWRDELKARRIQPYVPCLLIRQYFVMMIGYSSGEVRDTTNLAMPKGQRWLGDGDYSPPVEQEQIIVLIQWNLGDNNLGANSDEKT